MVGLLNNCICAAVLFIDSEHRVVWMNEKASEWLGECRIGERRGCYRTASFGPGFCSICPTGRAIDGSRPAFYEFAREIKGVLRSFEVIALPVNSTKGPASVIEIVIEARESGLDRMKDPGLMARIEKMAAVGQLASGVAHELNTPLGTISILAKEIERVAANGAVSSLNEYLRDIQGEISRCKSIINDLLDFSRSGVASFVETDINALVSKTMEFLIKGSSRGQTPLMMVSTVLDRAVPRVRTDPDRLRQVLVNIIKNAMEAVEGKEDGSVTVATGFEDGSVRVSVVDNGPGIPQQNIKRVFEPFFTTKPVGKGTGLGLSVSYGIMRDLNGNIGIESVEGGGTRAVIMFPASFPEVKPGKAPEAGRRPQGRLCGGG